MDAPPSGGGPRIVGWDTETTLGYVKCLCSSEGLVVETDATLPLLDALFEAGYRADYNVFWNVGFDFGAVVKRWLVANGARLKKNHFDAMKLRAEAALFDAERSLGERTFSGAEVKRRSDVGHEIEALESIEHFDLGKYRVAYIPRKGFKLTRAARKKGRNTVYFFDAMTFYAEGIGDGAALGKTAAKHLGETKIDKEEHVDVVRLGSEPGYYEAYRDNVVKYCIRDAELTARLFAKTVAGFTAIGYPFPEHPWSRASVGRAMLREKGTLEDTREAYERLSKSGHSRLWTKAYAGACILTRGVGSWDDVAHFDIASAYPHFMRTFPSLSGAFLVGPEDPRFASCFFKFYEVDLPPTPRRALRSDNPEDGDHLVYVHLGEPPKRTCVTGWDLELFDAFGDPYTVVDAVGVVTPAEDHPLAFLEELFLAKSDVKKKFGEDSVEYLNSKIPLNGVYGILTQSRPREGRYTNFIYGAYITSGCRRALWMKAKELEAQGGTVLAWQTDGLFVSGLPSLPPSSKKLGDWECEDVGLVTIFANGLYISKGKLKKRGAPDLTIPILQSSNVPYVTTKKARPLGLKAAIIRGKPEEVGVFHDEEKTLTPWEMLEGAGLRLTGTTLRSAPLASFFTERWYLDYRRSDEGKTRPHLWGAPRMPNRERNDGSGKRR